MNPCQISFLDERDAMMNEKKQAGAETIKSIKHLTPIPAKFSIVFTALCYRSALVSLVISDQIPQPICAGV